MNLRVGLLALAVIVVLAAVPRPAHAWSPIDSSRPTWSGTVPYALHSAGSEDLGIDVTETEVRRGMDDWTRVMCTGLTTRYDGRVATRPRSGDGQSTIGWVESGWRYDSNAIGVTSPRWWRSIVEADMELNGQNYTWTTASGVGSRVNAYSIILHEGGHYYGLGHSSDPRAAMYFAYSGGISTLNADDQNGIRALYPSRDPMCESGTDCTTTGCPAGQVCVDRVCRTPMGDGMVCSPCSSGADCAAGGVCLRYPDGGAYCGRACASSAACGAFESCVYISGVGGQCVRLSGGIPSCTGTTTGCTSDSQCAATERCNTSTGRCEPRPTTGGDLGAECEVGADCRSGLCFAGRCSQSCDWLAPTSCPSGWYCSGEATGSCTAGGGVCVLGSPGSGALGDSCGAATDCASAYCASGYCTQPCIPGGAAGCPSGYSCQVGAVPGCGSCQRSGSIGDPCEVHEECTSRLCAMLEGEGFCTEFCEGEGSCPDGFTCESAGAGVSVCVPVSGTLGTRCARNEDCLSGVCASEGGERSYCTRLCDDVTSPCPRGFDCIETSDSNVRVCRPPIQGGCGCAAPGRGTRSHAQVLVLALMLACWAVLRRRR